MFVNATKLYQFKTKNLEIKDNSVYLGNVSKDFTINNMKKTGLKGVVGFFFVDFHPIDTNDIIEIHEKFDGWKEHDIKCLELIKKCLCY